MRYAIVSCRRSATNELLQATSPAWDVLSPSAAVDTLLPGDVALGRLDVRPSLDGVDGGLWALGELEASGVRVLNGPAALLAAHDKLLTARLLHRSGLPHPRTRLVREGDEPRVRFPVVVKPRFGSWGRDVVRCDDRAALSAALADVCCEPWFQAHGALLQELVPPLGHDLRIVVAGRRVVGSIRRVAAPGEWRTNVALGARRHPATPPRAAVALAVAAAAAAGIDLVGVDLLPDGDGWTVLELNGAVDFTAEYAPGGDVFAAVSAALADWAARPAVPADRPRVAAGAA
jgi:RimK family alpha-L-glutamate ligase